jgi:DNA-binding transcriptional LysR family regulator
MDLLVMPVDDVPARYAAKVVLEEEFVIAGRARHPFFRAPTLARYCEAQHLLVSMTGYHRGHVDDALAERGLSRRVALTVPNFMLALTALADTDLLAAIPQSLAVVHARTFGLTYVKAPFSERRWPVCAVAPKVALADAGIAWLLTVVERAVGGRLTPRSRQRKRRASGGAA